MALEAGSITVDSDGSATGTGLAYAMFSGALGSVTAANRARIAADIAPFFEGLAEAIIDHITANAEITVTIETTDVGLQRTPNPNNAETATLGPATQKVLTGSIE